VFADEGIQSIRISNHGTARFLAVFGYWLHPPSSLSGNSAIMAESLSSYSLFWKLEGTVEFSPGLLAGFFLGGKGELILTNTRKPRTSVIIHVRCS
jgi:hypothetical protein